MKLRVSLICFLCFAVSCKGVWTSKDVYRPKHPKFKILKQEFIGNPLIDTNHLYISTINYIDDGKKKSVYNCAGFYSDGRMIAFSLGDDELEKMNQVNTWETAYSIGYYTTSGNKIRIEYFVMGDGGQYIFEEGLILKDTILIGQHYTTLRLERKTAYERLIKSDVYQIK
jgi:hypothetical protein